MRRETSLRTGLLRVLLLGTGSALLLAALGFRLVVGQWLRDEFDSALESKARALATLTKEEAGQVELDFADEFMPEFERQRDPEYFELWLGEEVLERSHSLGVEDLARPPSTRAVTLFDVQLPDGRAGRQILLRFEPQVEDEEDLEGQEEEETDLAGLVSGPQPAPATIAIARGRAELGRRLAMLDGLTASASLGLLLLVAALTRVGVGVGLRPVERLRDNVAALDADSLDQRLEVAEVPTELASMVRQINALLDRIERSVARERRLSSDLAHELRTPIAELRSVAEVGGRLPEDRDAVARFFRDVQEIALQMERTAINLLELSRMEAGVLELRAERIELRPLVEETWRRLPARQRGERTWRWEVRRQLGVVTDRSRLELIVSNVLANALSHSPAGDEIVIAAGIIDDLVELEVSNTTLDLEAGDLEVMFERFWRKDSARSGKERVGLGLALVRATAALLGLRVEAALENRRLRISIAGLKLAPR